MNKAGSLDTEDNWYRTAGRVIGNFEHGVTQVLIHFWHPGYAQMDRIPSYLMSVECRFPNKLLWVYYPKREGATLKVEAMSPEEIQSFQSKD
ncbi:hypothetical protein KFE98_16140 [bacterium SCSIO 12741]|nr:hypothetical protein KFE98_16140 [bacterium SCSIO 12741]